MHLLLTDHLVCPRCGPPFGLILLAHRMEERRVLQGDLGCPNCRERYPVADGFADLRPPPRDPLPPAFPSPVPPADPQETVRIAAMLGITEGPGFVLLAGTAATHAAALARMVEGLECLVPEAEAQGWGEEQGVSRLAVEGRFPLQDRMLRGAVLGGGDATHLLAEVLRTVGFPGRVVILGGGDASGRRLLAGGLTLLLDHPGAVVGARR